MTQEEKVALLKEAGVWDVIGYPSCIDKLFDLVAEPWIETNKALAKEIIEMKKQAEQEPVSMFEWQNGNPVGLRKAAPVRTKDLTDDELDVLWRSNGFDPMDFARAVIAADREKNK